jgi:hypothetical protein
MVPIKLVAAELRAGVKYTNRNFQRNRIFAIKTYVRAAGFFDASARIVVRTLFGTCSNVSGSME